MRDWLTTRHNASYRGVPFFVEKDNETSGRRLVVHQFINRDEHFVEDIGEEARTYTLTAYVVSDSADGEGTAIADVCRAKGAGSLVLPMQGPKQVRCKSCKRAHDKDKGGWAGFELEFVSEGAALALPSAGRLGQMSFDAAAAVAPAAAAMAATALILEPVADYAVAAATNGLANAAATLEAVRSTIALEPVQSGLIRDELTILFNDAQPIVAATTLTEAGGVARIIQAAQAIGDAAERPDTAGFAFKEILDAPRREPASGAVSVSRKAASANAVVMDRVLRLAAVTAMAEAYVRRPYKSRREGVTARGEIAEYLEWELQACFGAEDAELFVALQVLQGTVVDFLARLITDLAPVIFAGSAARMPSLWWAWRLYQDPGRAGELAGRNHAEHPGIMPAKIEALAR